MQQIIPLRDQCKRYFEPRCSFSPQFSLTKMKQTNIGDGEATGASSAGSAYSQP
jgi:hypothetical protein